jgi:hypothetical protein
MKKILYTSLLVTAILHVQVATAQNDPGPTVGDTGTVSFSYQGNAVLYTTVRAADGQIWLQQNLGTSAVAGSATDTAGYGHLFQWGRWDDGHQLRNSTTALATSLSSNNPSGLGTGSPNFYRGNNPNDWWASGNGSDTWSDAPPSVTNGTDPCAAIGPNWHLPAQSEWAAMLTLENITNVATAFASNLKLTAAGMREANAGNLLNVGLYGNYWTSTTSGIYAKDVTLLDNGVNPNDDALRSYGFSVRCVTSCTGVFPPSDIEGADTVCEHSWQTFSVPEVANAEGYIWSVPAGWIIEGSDSGNSIQVLTGDVAGIVSVMARNRCDTSEEVALSVHVLPAPDPVIQQTGAGVLSTSEAYTAYQWLLEEEVIDGATDRDYLVNGVGSYRVIVTDSNGCSDTSATFEFSISVHELSIPDQIQIFPNPAKNLINIKSPAALNLTVCNLEGRTIFTASNAAQVDVSELPTGMYFLRMYDIKGQLLKVDKLIILR